MKSLLATLHDYDPGMLPALAEIWGVDSRSLADDAAIRQLQCAMLDPAIVEKVWDKLDEPARTALQLLVSSAQGRMKVGQFERFYGKIRKMGKGQINREKPHQQGATIAETLYYRGFIGEGFDKVEDQVNGFIYVASDLVVALPLHKTSYENLDENETAGGEDLPGLGLVEDVDEVSPADTSIIDDMTTLLAILQSNAAVVEAERFAPQSIHAISPHLLNPVESRLTFMLGAGVSANLITLEEGRAHPSRGPARSWLNATRPEQIRTLANAWRDSQSWRDMWHIPGLYPDDSGWSYDPAAARNAIIGLLGDLLPDHGWISVNDLIEIIKEFEPDFQRLNGDYDSWYIRNDAGEYLTGFESWDAVEGSLIEYYIVGPMHWLGLVDIGDDVMRLTAYGRAFLEISDWPKLVEAPARIKARNDGTLLASRRVNRFERFQLARFAHCLATGDPYVYALDADSIQRAAPQGITTSHIHSFIAKHLDGQPVPLPILKLLRNWQDGAKTSVTMESVIVLRTTSEETMEKIFAIPAFRRYLGARLGPMACAVRADQWEALRTALGETGIEVDITQLRDDSD